MNYFVLITFLIVSLDLHSQSIFNEDLEWYFTNTIIPSGSGDLTKEKYSVQIGGDITLNNIDYKQLLFKKNESEGYLPSDKYIRKVNDTVLVYHANEDIEMIEFFENTYLDQIISVNQTFQSCSGKVIEIDSIESFGKTYKTTKLDWIYRVWIEGIGTDKSMFTIYTCSNQGNIVELNCVHENGVIIYQSDDNIECSDHFTANEEITELADITVFPNPANNILQFNKPVSHISIYDGMGKLLIDKVINRDFMSIDNLSKGIYFLILRDKNNNTQLEKLIKI